MSPPHILLEDDYQKPLHDLPANFNYQSPNEVRYFYNQTYGNIFKIQELKANNGSEYAGCIELFSCYFNEMALDGVCAVAEDFDNPYEAASKALEAFEIESETLIGRYSFKDFEIKDTESKIGKQIKGAYLSESYQQFGISPFIYKYLATKYGVLVCDNTQTYMGHMLWALSILKWGIIKVYDCVEHKFIGEIDHQLDPAPIKPWSVPFNFPMQKEKHLRQDMCVRTDVQFHNIVLVVDNSTLS